MRITEIGRLDYASRHRICLDDIHDSILVSRNPFIVPARVLYVYTSSNTSGASSIRDVFNLRRKAR